MSDANINAMGDPSGDTPEYVEAMVAKAEGRTTEEPATPETPEGESLLAGKFKTPEDLEKGYLELQARFSSRSPEEDTSADNGGSEGDGDGTPETPTSDLPERTEDTPSEMPDGIDFNKYSQSIADNGSLTEDDYSELAEKHKLPREVVDMYVRGLQTEVSDRTKAAIDAAGGETEFEKVRSWASEELPDKDYNAVRKALTDAQSPEDVSVIYGMLAQRYKAAHPGEPTLLAGDNPVQPSVSGFRSRKEMTDAINDPRYQTDDAYRKDVEQKVVKSTFI